MSKLRDNSQVRIVGLKLGDLFHVAVVGDAGITNRQPEEIHSLVMPLKDFRARPDSFYVEAAGADIADRLSQRLNPAPETLDELVDVLISQDSATRLVATADLHRLIGARVKIADHFVSSLPTGVTVIMGPGGVGKSAIAEQLAVDHDGTLLRFSEPESGITSLAFLIEELAAAVLLKSPVTVVDSVKKLTFLSTGSSGAGGVDVGIYADFTDLSVLGTQAGVSLVLIWNPLAGEGDTARFELLTEQMKSSLAALLVLRDQPVNRIARGRLLSRSSTGRRIDEPWELEIGAVAEPSEYTPYTAASVLPSFETQDSFAAAQRQLSASLQSQE